MIRHLLILMFLPTIVAAAELNTGELIDGPQRALLDKPYIGDDCVGFLAIPFERATSMLSDNDLHKLLQETQKSTEGVPAFELSRTAPGQYQYINENAESTKLHILWQGKTRKNTYDMVVHGEGHRFFGHFEAITHLQIIQASETGIIYRARLYAYPHRATTRFIARRIDAVQDNFKKNTNRLILLTESWMRDQIGQGDLKSSNLIP